MAHSKHHFSKKIIYYFKFGCTKKSRGMGKGGVGLAMPIKEMNKRLGPKFVMT